MHQPQDYLDLVYYIYECRNTLLLVSYSCVILLSFHSITQVISTWGAQNNIDFLSLSYTRHAEDVRHVRVIADVFNLIAYVFWVSLLIFCVYYKEFPSIMKACANLVLMDNVATISVTPKASDKF